MKIKSLGCLMDVFRQYRFSQEMPNHVENGVHITIQTSTPAHRDMW